MTATTDGHEMATETEEATPNLGAGSTEELAVENGSTEKNSYGALPWIGALHDPRVGPMVVFNDNGYLIPLCTPGDLLRGCKYFWRAARD